MSLPIRTLDIDGDAIVEYAQEHGMTLQSLGLRIGRSSGYLYGVVKVGQMKENVYNIMKEVLNLPDGAFLKKKEDPKPVTEQGGATDGYHLALDVKSDRLKLGLFYGDEKMYESYSWIKGNTEFDLVQAISYAAHLLYKKAEQEVLQE